jgi:hypothetical protein
MGADGPIESDDNLVDHVGACNGCRRTIFWDESDHAYHHMLRPWEGCFLIPPEDNIPKGELAEAMRTLMAAMQRGVEQ